MKIRVVILYGLVFLAAAVMTPWIGPEKVGLSPVIQFLKGITSPGGEIFWFQRVPRVLLALFAGGTLAVVGASFQVLFRNPLVEPFTLGISGGAALGAFLTIAMPSLWIVWGPFSSIQLFAIVGASFSLALIYMIAHRPQGMSVYTLLLAGVTISIICAGSILFLTYLASPNALVVFQRWMMGGIDIIGYREFASLIPLLFPALGLLFYHANDLNHIALNEELALGHGVEVGIVRRNIFIAGGLATAAVVSLVGPIAFVGLIVPHAVRRLSGFDQRLVLPCSFFLGGASLCICDAVARSIIAPTELPVGIITAILGGPLFIYLLVSRRWR
jgi:iron complex transport system permease protein